ncbi:MAG: PDGLE domain-containing protein [Solirubrobacteraceae bacterium]
MRSFTIVALAVAVGLATAVSPFASSSPDGLQRVAADAGFLDRGRATAAPAPGYAAPGVGDDRIATGLAGLAGTLAVFGTAAAIGRRRGT